MKELTKSKAFKITALVIGLIIIILASFGAGMSVGFKKARFSYSWGENYERNFIGPNHDRGMGMMRPGFPPEFGGKNFRNAHGIAGAIVSITEDSIVIKDRDNNENTIAITDRTVIKNGRDDIEIADLEQDEKIVVLGKPSEDGVVNADLIRVLNDGNQPNAEQESNFQEENNVEEYN
ncbi:MAG TPA: hypothetical protein PLK35_03995 [Candidatus Moranbacteria bacterium]|mgnify:CR=1 FL=1|nr:hypothetical protein [Candidatus Moranbacteria bacterium]